jgi:hypothetical protein
MELNMYIPEFLLKISDVCHYVWVARLSNNVTDMGTVCEYGYSFRHGFTWYY